MFVSQLISGKDICDGHPVDMDIGRLDFWNDLDNPSMF